MAHHLETPELLETGRTLYVDGIWSGAVQSYECFDPADLSRRTGCFAQAGPENVRAAYAAAASAQPGWATTPAPQRSRLLRRAADLLEEVAEPAARALVADMGKAIRDARAEVLRSVEILRYYSGELLQADGQTYPSGDADTTLLTVEQPLGLVCAITPWNFPIAIPTWKLAPALGFGNAVVWKPAESAAGSAVLLTELLATAGLPAGVLNLVTGSGSELSPALTGESRLGGLTFTGSAEVGVRLRAAVADRNVKLQLELGGKNPAIVLADADLVDAAVQIVRGAMLSTGQRCTATSRVYVERSVATRLRQQVVEQVERLVVGDPYDASTDVGPLASTDQWERVGRYLEIADREGVEVLAGGEPMVGCFAPPTVLAGVDPDSALVREEIFGPVLVLTEVDGFEEALEAANDTEFGLSASIFTRDLGRALEFVRRSQSGIVHVNRETAGVEPHVPFGGIKGSSNMQREQGTAARQFFTTTKTVYLRTVSPAEGVVRDPP